MQKALWKHGQGDNQIKIMFSYNFEGMRFIENDKFIPRNKQTNKQTSYCCL